VGVQEARWEGGGTGQATEYILLMRKGEWDSCARHRFFRA
jgi:hypothetical protein